MASPEPLRYLNAGDFRRALPMARAIEAMEEVFRAEAAGRAHASERQTILDRLDGDRVSMLLTMPAAWSGRAFATKVVGFIADNPARGRPAVQGIACLLDARTGAPRLIVDAGALTVRRTAAMVGLATARLARSDAHVLGLVGTGALAADMISAVCEVRPIEKVVAFNRTASRAHELAARASIPVEVVATSSEAARDADILVVATSSTRPVVPDRAIRPGTHINAVGCFSPAGRELEGTTVGRAEVWVDGLEGAVAEAGDLILAADEGRLGPLPGSIRGDLARLASSDLGDGSGAELTLFKSVGSAVADLGGLLAAAVEAESSDLGIRLS